MDIVILTSGLKEKHRDMIADRFRAPVFRVLQNSNGADVIKLIEAESPRIIILESSGQRLDEGLSQVRRIKEANPRLPIVLISQKSNEARATAAFRAGVDDYFKEPFSPDQFLKCIHHLLRAVETGGGLEVLPCKHPAAIRPVFIGDSSVMVATRNHLLRAAATESTVLITGETGTGKELAAKLIHYHSARAAHPLVSVNCAALPESLAESELFGYERGAFTGATESRKGKFSLADDGTIFLDEIGDMTPHIQAKILHTIENKVIYPLGGNRAHALNVRVVAATNKDLESLVHESRFRNDLYYRLNIVRVHLPPLRNRAEDIQALAQHGIERLNRHFHREVKGLTPGALAFLQAYSWPGNVRELMNLLESTFIDLGGDEITRADLPPHFRAQAEKSRKCPESEEREVIVTALLQTNWNKSRAARELNWSRMTLYRKMSRLKITETQRPDRHKAFRSM